MRKHLFTDDRRVSIFSRLVSTVKLFQQQKFFCWPVMPTLRHSCKSVRKPKKFVLVHYIVFPRERGGVWGQG